MSIRSSWLIAMFYVFTDLVFFLFCQLVEVLKCLELCICLFILLGYLYFMYFKMLILGAWHELLLVIRSPFIIGNIPDINTATPNLLISISIIYDFSTLLLLAKKVSSSLYFKLVPCEQHVLRSCIFITFDNIYLFGMFR